MSREVRNRDVKIKRERRKTVGEKRRKTATPAQRHKQ